MNTVIGSIQIDWLVMLNRFLDGLSFGAGLVLVFILFALFVRNCGKKEGDT